MSDDLHYLTDNSLLDDREDSKFIEQFKDKTVESLQDKRFFASSVDLGFLGLNQNAKVICCNKDGRYRTTNLVGHLTCGSTSCVIGSRFCKNKQKIGLDFFTLYMINKVCGFPVLVQEAQEESSVQEYYILLVLYFVLVLKIALRKGLPKDYISKEYNDNALRGSIDIARHVRKNTPFVGNVAYRVREHSYDNCLTQLIRHTIEEIRSTPRGTHVLSLAQDEVKQIEAATQTYRARDRSQIILNNKNRSYNHPYYSEYLDLQNICINILEYKQIQLATKDTRIGGMLMDVAWLWEEYINTLIGEWFEHPQNKINKGKRYLFVQTSEGDQVSESKQTGVKVGQIYPDFISKRSDPRRVIIDTKYKKMPKIGSEKSSKLDSEDGGNKDYFQMLAYMLRLRSTHGMLCYVDTKEVGREQRTDKNAQTWEKAEARERSNARTLKLDTDPQDGHGTASWDMTVKEYAFVIPDDEESLENYNLFKEKMEEREKDFKKCVFELLGRSSEPQE